MPAKQAASVQEYLASLVPETRRELETVRNVILENLPDGYVEDMAFGMIGYAVPLSRYKSRHNPNPLAYAALAAHKTTNTVYLMSVYSKSQAEAALRAAFDKAGKKLDIGKSCVHFKKADDLALDAIGAAIASTPVDEWIRIFEASRRRSATQ